MSDMTLDRLAGYSEFPGPVVTVIMDGVGIGPQNESNGVFLANTPVLDALSQEPLFAQLKAHGTAVGMPSDDDMGNSEVGHNALGAGRVFPGRYLFGANKRLTRVTLTHTIGNYGPIGDL